ncbi:MAG: Smr/MutS family endonuclease [Gammaproteobacteria bacterium]|nr:Smr/MutS family endonuclease [Gammaproteobacteria bacterium]
MSIPENHDDDADLFKQLVGDIKPLKQDRVSLRRKPAAIKKRPQQNRHEIMDTLSDDFIPECGDYLEFMRPGIQKSLLKQIRNGKLGVEARLDLHGYTRDDARKNLLQFIADAQAQGCKLVCIVHGKGYNSEDGRPVLKAMVNKWLQQIEPVLAFTSAQPKDGGSGAVYVLIKKFQDE